jgi:virulence factor Mce-like protein
VKPSENPVNSIRPPRRRGRRHRRRTLSHAAERLERHPAPLGLAVLAVALFLTYISIIAINGIPFATYRHLGAVLPASGPIIARGDDVLIAGQRVGEVRGVTPTRQGRLVSFTISPSIRVGRDASAIIRLRGLAGATYLQLDPGNPAQPAPRHFTIPLSRTSTNTQLTDVIAAFGAATRRSLSRTLIAYGPALGAAGPDVNQAIAELPATLTGITPLLKAFNPSPGQLSGFVHQADRTLVGLGGQHAGDFGRLLSAAPAALGALISHRAALGRSIDELGPFSGTVQSVLPIADPVLIDAAAAARSLDPAVGALQRALPSLSALVSRSRQLGSLSRLARGLEPVLPVARQALVALWPGAASLAPLAAGIDPLARYAARYPQELLGAPQGFVNWGGFRYDFGQAAGAPAVRFAPVFTCAPGRDPYPAPGAVYSERKPCPGS